VVYSQHSGVLPAGRLPSALGWLATDVTIVGNYVVAGTTQPWQIKTLRALLGRPEKIEINRFTVTTEGLKPAVRMKWRREVLNSAAREDVWAEKLVPGVKGFDDLIRLRWDVVVNAVKEARGRLAKHTTCRGGGQCGEPVFINILSGLCPQ